ncbi:MAG TPA: hypothetical protein VN887_00430 [Candidatus Angelobacter sp.]|nr:hypothetical protein [Candidatus Angelobacter sp.]
MSKHEQRIALLMVLGLVSGTFWYFSGELGLPWILITTLICVPILTVWYLKGRKDK